VEPPTLRTSERSAFKRCPQLWWWAYREGLKSKAKPADALWFGIGIHEALAMWYGEGYDRGNIPSDTFEDWVGDEIRFIEANYSTRDREWYDKPKYEEAADLGIAMLDNYLEHFGEDPYWEVLAIEQPFEIEIVDRSGEVIAIFKSRFDGVAINHKAGQIELLEHKTAGSIRTQHLALDDQAGSYFAVATIVLRHQDILGPKENIEGIRYNFLRKSMPDLRPRDEHGRYLNKNGEVSKRQSADPFHREFVDRTQREVNQQIRKIADEVALMNRVRSGEVAVTKTVTNMCPNCPFFRMCVLHERGGTSWKEYRDAMFHVENPYEDMRKSANE
jgi:hypothetical protein